MRACFLVQYSRNHIKYAEIHSWCQAIRKPSRDLVFRPCRFIASPAMRFYRILARSHFGGRFRRWLWRRTNINRRKAIFCRSVGLIHRLDEQDRDRVRRETWGAEEQHLLGCTKTLCTPCISFFKPVFCTATVTRPGQAGGGRRKLKRMSEEQGVRKSNTACRHRIAHSKWKETKLQPGTAGPGNRHGCCFVSFHFLWAILCPQAVHSCRGARCCSTAPHFSRLDRFR